MTPESIKKMSLAEKLQTMEQLWDSLIEDDNKIDSPAWHEDILAKRKQKIESGEAKFITLDELKKLKSK